jgi:cytochrome c5
MPIEFGALVPCRTCHGAGVSRNPDWGDRDLARERQRNRRHGRDVDRPSELIKCVECDGGGFMPPEAADARRMDRPELQATSVIGPRR